MREKKNFVVMKIGSHFDVQCNETCIYDHMAFSFFLFTIVFNRNELEYVPSLASKLAGGYIPMKRTTLTISDMYCAIFYSSSQNVPCRHLTIFQVLSPNGS